MKKLISVLLLSATCSAAIAGDVIANSSLDLGAGDVKDVFLGEKQMAGGVKIVPVDNASQQDHFLSAVVGMDAAKYQGMWTKKAFRDGVNAPAVKGSDSEVASFVKATPGAVGYVGSAPPGVKVLRKF